MKSLFVSGFLTRLNPGLRLGSTSGLSPLPSLGFSSGIHSKPNPESTSEFFISPDVKARPGVRKYPLTGIKVALLNRPSIGDFTAKVLEDYGAEVKKFSEPLKNFENIQETKIDLTKKEDVNLIKNIAKKVDIIIDCLEARRLEETGLDPKEMLKINSKLIVARITGYGQTGTYASRTGADATFSALSGAMSGMESQKESNEGSLKVASREAKALTMAGRSNCVTGIILALYDREHTGRGQIVDMSVTESIAYIDRVAHLAGLQIPKPFHRFYTTLDKKLLAVGILSPNDQQKFLQLTGADSTGNLEANISEQIAKKEISEWLSILKDLGSVAEVLSHTNVGTHKQHRERNSFELDRQSNKWIAKSAPRFFPN